MKVVYKRVCMIDIHKKQINTCIIINDAKEFHVFGTTTGALLEFCGLLKDKGVEISAMESTASYWKSVYNLMEVEGLLAIPVNAQHIKNVPGRKTDVKDSEWIADLLRHGLLRPSFVPPRDHRELREIVRYRASIVEERSREINRMEKVLQGANINLSSAVSSVTTASGMDMIRAISEGITDSNVLAAFARGNMKAKTEELKKVLDGLVQAHQRTILKSMLVHLDEHIQGLDEDIFVRLKESGNLIERLDEIPGVGRRSAEVIIAEIGTDMGQFPSAAHLASWAGCARGTTRVRAKIRAGRLGRAIRR